MKDKNSPRLARRQSLYHTIYQHVSGWRRTGIEFKHLVLLPQHTHKTTSGSAWTTRLWTTTSAGQTALHWWAEAQSWWQQEWGSSLKPACWWPILQPGIGIKYVSLKPHIAWLGRNAVFVLTRIFFALYYYIIAYFLSNMKTGDPTSRITTSAPGRTVWSWSGMRTASGTMSPATTTCRSPARKAQVCSWWQRCCQCRWIMNHLHVVCL